MEKTILVTGATDGMGLETARALASDGHHIIIHGRSQQKLLSVLKQLPAAVDGAVADFSIMKEVAQLATTLANRYKKIDVIINNAGVLKTPNTRTVDNLDIRFAVNSYAPYLLTKMLMPVLSDSARIVNVASAAQATVDMAALVGQQEITDDYSAYSQSKLALIMWTNDRAAQKSTDDPIFVSVNPGSLLSTKMVKEGFGQEGRDIQIGVNILVRAAISEEFSEANGRYFDNDSGQFAAPHQDALDNKKCTLITDAIAQKLGQIL